MGSGFRRGIFHIIVFLDVAWALYINSPDSIRTIAQSFNTSVSVLGSSVPSLNASGNSRFGCSGRQYGYGLDVLSCLDAYAHLERRSTAPQSWGPRRSDMHYDIGLPRSCWSCKESLRHQSYLSYAEASYQLICRVSLSPSLNRPMFQPAQVWRRSLRGRRSSFNSARTRSGTKVDSRWTSVSC